VRPEGLGKMKKKKKKKKEIKGPHSPEARDLPACSIAP
jgi:hypothetical protein